MTVLIKYLARAAALAIALAVAASDAAAQQIIQGRIVEDRTNRPVDEASVMLLAVNGRELDRIVKTNKHGAFQMRVEQGRYRLSIRRLGFQPVTSDIIDVQPLRNVNLSYILTPVTVRLAKVEVVERPGLETGSVGMAKREAMGTGGVFLYAKDFKEIATHPVWEIIGQVEGLRPRIDGSIEALKGHQCLQFLLNRLPIAEVPGQFVMLSDEKANFASLYEMLPDGTDIAGIEIYRTFAEVPKEFRMDAWPNSPLDRGVTQLRYIGSKRRISSTLPCGLVNIWTNGAWR